MYLLASLKHRPFFLLWSGQTISRLGDQVYTIALAWWVLEKTHSATAMGGVLIAAFLPTVVFVLVGGVVADRLPRLTIMLVSDLTRGVLVMGIALLAFTGTLPLWPVIGVSFCFGVMDAFFLPAYGAVIPQILPPDALPSANSLRVLSGQSMAIIGPGLGAALIVIGGAPFAFVINGASFFIAALCLLNAIPLLHGLTRLPPAAPSRPNIHAILTQFRRDFREGLTTVQSMTWLWLTIVIAGVANLIAEGGASVALPFYVLQTLKSPLLYGGMTAASATGSILGAIWFGSRSWRHRGALIYGFFIIAMLALMSIGMLLHPVVIVGGMLIYGLCSTMLGLAWTTALQVYVPTEQMGRVVSIDQLGSYLGVPLSFGLAGVITDHLGAPAVLTWGGIVAAIIVASGWLSRSVRALD